MTYLGLNQLIEHLKTIEKLIQDDDNLNNITELIIEFEDIWQYAELEINEIIKSLT